MTWKFMRGIVVVFFAGILIIGGAWTVTDRCRASEAKGASPAQEMPPPPNSKLPFVDEGVSDESFRLFRERLLEALRERDTGFIESILDDRIANVDQLPGAEPVDVGPEVFKRIWQTNNKYSPLWETLGEILLLGGSFETQNRYRFTAPYVYSKKWPGDLEHSGYVAITGTDIDVREEPSPRSRVLTRLTYDIVPVDYSRSNAHWVNIVAPTSERGYVFKNFTRSKSDYAAGFIRTGDTWKLAWLIGRSRLPEPPP